jgi:hypothetical protein
MAAASLEPPVSRFAQRSSEVGDPLGSLLLVQP